MKALALNYNINQPDNFKVVAGMMSTKNDNTVFQWDFNDISKSNAMKEIRQALKNLKKNGTIDC